MGNARKPHRDQRKLNQDPTFLAKEEDKRLVKAVSYADVVAYCEERGRRAPTKGEWHNGVQILTFFIICRGPLGIVPKQETMAAKAFGKLRSVKTVERTTGMLEALGVITSEPRGLLGNSYTIHFDWLAEIRAAGVRKRDGSNPTFNPTNGGVDGAACRVERPEMSDYATENVGLPIRGINQEPTFNQPTTTESSEPDVSDWAAVEVEVSKCGVNQARAAVHLALSTPGMTPVFIRENLRYWRQHKTGWSHAAVVLYRRLLQVEPGKSADEDWPEFDVPGYQAKLDLERLAIQNAEECRRQLERRKEYLEEREQCAAEHANLGVTLESLMAPIDPDFARNGPNPATSQSCRRTRLCTSLRACVQKRVRAQLCPAPALAKSSGRG